MPVYLDHNATSPLHPLSAQAMMEEWSTIGNPSAIHCMGQTAKRRLETHRQMIADHLGTQPSRLIFTSGGTEANSMILSGAKALGMTVLCSAIEHDSVRSFALPDGMINVTPEGIIDLQDLEIKTSRQEEAFLVSLMIANNETGIIQPILEASAIIKKNGGLLHTDATQALGKMPINMNHLQADSLTISAHKCGGPVGIGALVLPPHVKVPPLLKGGSQEFGYRAGTQNLPAIAGMAAVISNLDSQITALSTRQLRDELESNILSIAPEAVIYGKSVQRLPNTSCFSVRGLTQETQLIALDAHQVCISAGAACASKKISPSHVLLAMNASEEEARSAIRVSFGWSSSQDDVSSFFSAWSSLYLRAKNAPLLNISPSFAGQSS